PHAVAGRARIGDFLAAAVAGRAGLLHAEEALLHAHRAGTAAGAAGLGRGAGLGAAAVAGFALFPARHADLGVEAVGGLLQGDFQRILEIGAAVHLRAAATAPRGGAEDLAEDVAERVGEAAPHATAHAGGVRVDAGMAIAVIGGALLLVAQDFIGFLDFLELFLGVFAVRIAVRMVLHGQLPVGLLQFIVRGVLRHAQDFVVIAFCHIGWARERAVTWGY